MKKNTGIIILFCILLATSVFAKDTRLLRFPNASQTQITFCYGGDIYTVPVEGGLARKLTNSEGFEMFPRISPDGKQIAFSAEYDGNRDIYLIPAEGGAPQRLTYSMDLPGLPERMGPDKIIMQWTYDGKKILYRARKDMWNSMLGKLYYISTEGGLPEEVPLPRAGFASLSPDGKKLAYNRVFREFRTWKRYRGGQADDIWIYDFTTKKLENITNNEAQDIIPMWSGNKIYFVSDRDHTLNLFVYDLTSKQTKKLTNFDKYDLKFPSLGGGYIAFENGGYIYLLDTKTDQAKKVDIEIAGDFPDARTAIVSVDKNILRYEIAPDGNRALFSSRGDIFTVPAEKGKIYNLTKSSGIHDRDAMWSPDGKWIAFISDRSGEFEIYICKPDGSEVTQLTKKSKSYLYDMKWSPDSKKLLCSDKEMRLFYVDIESKDITEVTKSKWWEIRDYSWSPDSKWIAYSDNYDVTEQTIFYLYSLANGKSYEVTDKFFNSFNPVFSQDGKYLFFVSFRTFNPAMGLFEMSYVYNNMAKIYGLTLQDTLKSPFFFENDTVTVKQDEETKEKDKKEKKEEKKDKKESESKDIKIDIAGIKDRIFELPIQAGNYRLLTPLKNKLYYVRDKLYVFDFEKREESDVGDIFGFEISADGKKILFNAKGDYYITNLGDKIKPDKGKLNLSDMKVELNRREEWTQIFEESWRQMRDFFYAPNMHEVDWKAMHDKYAELLPFVVHRGDLTYLISEMISELNVGHAYTGGGEAPAVAQVSIGLLGAQYELDKSSGFYKITKIYQGRNWDENTRSPLTEPGIEIKEGDYLIEIDGEKLTADYHPYKALVNKAKKYVTIKVNSKPTEDGAKEYDVMTIAGEGGLVYYNWVEENRKKVEKATNGKVGYIHIPNMMPDGLNEFVKYFYPQTDKEGLIIDDRYNGGGFVSPMIIERLRRVMTMLALARNQQELSPYPNGVFTGPMVCLLNEVSASDGDMFPYQFKQANLGKLIGKRSWGGVVGIRGSLPLLDGGYLLKPEFSHLSVDGKWVLEGYGMPPDIEVDNDPTLEYEGTDQQLNKAIEVVMEQIKEHKKTMPPIPPFPDKK